MISHLQLRNYFVTELSFRTNPAFTAEGEVRHEGKLHCTVQLGNSDETSEIFGVGLGIVLDPSETAPALDPYYITMRIVGFFSFQPGINLSDAEKQRMVSLNGCSILLGLARGLVAQATGVSEHGKYLLPPLNFVDVLKDAKTEDLSPPKSVARRAIATADKQ
jgi:preprotein translocase subunit SecB